MGDFKTIGKQFVDFYYQTFDSNRSGLGNLYQQNSMLTFENSEVMGRDAILQKLGSLKFATCQHVVKSLNFQPTPGNGVLVLCSGELKLDQSPPLAFGQVFHLMPLPGNPNGYYVHNDMFSLNYG
eukprot:TRINITY_DN15234_c0_g1_i1.p1 TRINITY_DN15234_c0_g1~~TRINITY_DN15234_c0_g1_i1.p1  ORF type:complete len:125 (+),score=14.03 TRINITY_DN15234_c0_g1_i1:130-504(+)